jgi:molybdopterin/thiamine biosynthesis adenylyltransferase
VASVSLRPYDQAAHERFAADLAAAGFSPTPGTARRLWTGPAPAALRAITGQPRMQVEFWDGWPYRYAHVRVPGMAADHAAGGLLCLWAEDDPAQIAGITLGGVLARLDQWCASTTGGFGPADQALDPHIAFSGTASRWAEVDLPSAVGTAANGHIAPVHGHVDGNALRLGGPPGPDNPLAGRVYFRSNLTRPPRDLDEVRAVLTRRQREDLAAGLAARTGAGQNEPSGGLDHAVLVWPRHGVRDALVLSFSGTGPTLKAHPNQASPTDRDSRLRRAGPDAPLIAGKSVLLAGAGALGGHVGVVLAHSGLGRLAVHDDDDLKTVNTVRHVLGDGLVGYPKAIGLHVRLKDTAPWCTVAVQGALTYDPEALAAQIRGHDLVVDCTGIAALSSALGHVAAAEHVPLLTAALYHQGAVVRIRRQTPGDTPLGQRHGDARYTPLPPETADPAQTGFLELGCTAPVHNAPPAAVLRAAADTAAAALDVLTGRNALPDETITVLTPLPAPPFDALGPVGPPR